MVGTIKAIATQQYWEDPYQYWAVPCSRSDSIRTPYRVLLGASPWPQLMGRVKVAMHERCWEGPFKHWAPYGIKPTRKNDQRSHSLRGLAHVQSRLECSSEPPLVAAVATAIRAYINGYSQ